MSRKRLSVMLFTMGTVLVVAGGAVFAQLRSGSYDSAKAGSIEQSAATQATPDANYYVSSFPSFTPELAEGEGKQEAQSFCAICHSTRYITMQPPLPAAAWDAVVHKMIKAYGAPIPEATAQKILSYLQAHYTPENRKQ